MSAVPQKVLHWLHGTLINEYHHVDRTYSDIAQTLSCHPTFALRTNVYTHETGASALLVNVQGTLPVNFRGTTYAFPISLWIPQEYPIVGPIGFVTPTSDMGVRVGQHVSAEGRVYHPYLAGWREDKSNLVDLCSILQGIFAREPPVVAREKQDSRQQSTTQAGTAAPPVPPLPPELEQGRPKQETRPLQSSMGPQPPPPPPKLAGGIAGHQINGGPPNLSNLANSNVEYRAVQPNPEINHPRNPPLDHRPQSQKASSSQYSVGMRDQAYQTYRTTNRQIPQRPISPLNSDVDRQMYRPPAAIDANQRRHVQQAPTPSLPAQPRRGRGVQYQATRQLPSQYPYHQSLPHSYQHQRRPEQNPQPPRSQPQEDLLSSPFEYTLPPQPANFGPPPIPPNPQKDALLSALSQTLTQQIHTAHNSNLSALPPLRAQQAALMTTINAINSEMSQLNDLEALLSSNEAILHKAMHDADKVLDDAKHRNVPKVDDVLVAPTVVAGQLYQLIAEERAIEESRSILGKALDKGRINSGVWARQSRSLAREEFLKKALIKKISRGMGLIAEEK